MGTEDSGDLVAVGRKAHQVKEFLPALRGRSDANQHRINLRPRQAISHVDSLVVNTMTIRVRRLAG